ncbi:MAG: S53 family peptidase [Acidobacteriaceae bacterium]
MMLRSNCTSDRCSSSNPPVAGQSATANAALTRGRKAAIGVAAVTVCLWLMAAAPAGAQNGPGSLTSARHRLVIPASSQAQPGDLGASAHTNIRIMVPTNPAPAEAPPYLGYGYETPASLACVYRLVQPIPGCNPNETTNTPTGGSQTIAIVDAYDDPGAAGDLDYFSEQFGIPGGAGNFTVVYAAGTAPPEDPTGGWELEESLDIEYAHAMAPHAKLYLVEATSNSDTDLFTAVTVAANLVRCGKETRCPGNAKGAGEVSMSWGGSEWSGETAYDALMTAPNVVYVAAAGDSAGVIYPSASPNVVSAGGTSTARSLVTGNLIAEIAWSDAGGGASEVEPRPSYQRGIARYAGPTRATPDISSDANPNTGVWVYDSTPYEGVPNPSDWWTVGGTSVASPTISGILNAAATASGHFASSGTAELTLLYQELANRSAYGAYFNDIQYGACNYYSGTFSMEGYDFCTGLGSPNTLRGK